MDESYAKIRNETDSLTECIGEVVQARKVHKNFKDEAARIRVHHKTNIIAADMYEAAYIDLQVIKLILLNKRMSEFHVCVCVYVCVGGGVSVHASVHAYVCNNLNINKQTFERVVCLCTRRHVCVSAHA